MKNKKTQLTVRVSEKACRRLYAVSKWQRDDKDALSIGEILSNLILEHLPKPAKTKKATFDPTQYGLAKPKSKPIREETRQSA